MNKLHNIKLNLAFKIKLLFSISAFVFSCNHKSNNQTDYEKQKIKVEQTICQIQNLNENIVIQNQLVHLGSDSLKKVELRKFIKKPRLMFYFSANTCSPCIDHTIEILKDVFPDYLENDQIVFISPDYPTRFWNNCYGKKLLIFENNKIGLPFEESLQPPLFLIINDSLKIKRIHLVNKMDFERTRIFLKYESL